MIMPSFSALLTDATYTNIAFTWKVFRNSGPFLGSVLLDKFDEIGVFLGGPRTFLPYVKGELHFEVPSQPL
jgi:hypothetical protein